MIGNLLLADEMNGARPKCWNRAPAAEGRWVRNGYCPKTLRVRLRWSPRWYEDRCATWDGTGIGPTPETTHYPQAHKFDDWCKSCRLRPVHV